MLLFCRVLAVGVSRTSSNWRSPEKYCRERWKMSRGFLSRAWIAALKTLCARFPSSHGQFLRARPLIATAFRASGASRIERPIESRSPLKFMGGTAFVPSHFFYTFHSFHQPSIQARQYPTVANPSPPATTRLASIANVRQILRESCGWAR
jgi:hypothetical protein